MPVDDFLLRDERILASAKAHSNASLYATNKRVIRYEKGLFNEKMDSLSYSHIVAASYESKSYIWLVVVGAIFTIIGAFIGSIGLMLVVFGIIAILAGILSRPAWYQLKAAGLTSSELKRWRTANAKEDAKTFARFIQDQISIRETPQPSQAATPITREREVITKEIVMIKCDYCDALMPQIATFCPHCGAKRK